MNLELQKVVTYMVLRLEPGSHSKRANTLNLQAISPALYLSNLLIPVGVVR